MSKKIKMGHSKDGKSESRTMIKQHRRSGHLLVPPLSEIPNLKLASWTHDRLPEMLWALLLVSLLPRDIGLACIRQLAIYIRNSGEPKATGDVTISGFAKLDRPDFVKMISNLADSVSISRVLRPLTVFPDLPGRDAWIEVVGEAEPDEDWHALMTTVGKSLFHQSQEATDARWARVLGLLMVHHLILPSKELLDEFIRYPEYGDQKSVQPSIRAAEGTLDLASQRSPSDWVRHFWDHSYGCTPCWPMRHVDDSPLVAGTTQECLDNVYKHLQTHYKRLATSTSVNARLEIVLGVALYSVGILKELLSVGASQSIGGRLQLRTLVEAAITLNYLAKKDDGQLWTSYRAYGAGQAKLISLKCEETGDTPSYLDIETIKQLANEDHWEEFLSINIGHWENSNLRALSEASGQKAIYDKYYGWPSTFTHAHWGAIRETVFSVCGNPLHRLHRITLDRPRTLRDVVTDACNIVDVILSAVEICYPEVRLRVCI